MRRTTYRAWGNAALFAGVMAVAAPPVHAAGDGLDARTATLLQQAVAAKATVMSGAGPAKMSAIYLGTAAGCAFAALVRRGLIDNFSLCGGVVVHRKVSPPAWPDTPASREFRERVMSLAVLYGSSSGIDANGYKIRARLTEAHADACKIAEVSTMVDNALVRLDLLPACPH